jgi:N-acetylmuramoyl-L-alanine amidase
MTLERDSTGDEVLEVQKCLNRLGYLREPDASTSGPRTRVAVIAYQADHGLDSHGVADTGTRDLLARHVAELDRMERLSGLSPEVSGVLHCPSPNRDERPEGSRVDTVVIHYTDVSLVDTLKLLTREARKASTHYVVDRSGRLFQLVAPHLRAWHAGRSTWKGRENVNDFAIGIDAVFEPSRDDGYTDEQYRVIARLVWELGRTFPVDGDSLVGHEHVALPEGRKKDPGPCFDWARLRQLLARR